MNDPLAARILAGLLAHAAGDAAGLPWEGTPPHAIVDAELFSFAPGRNTAFEPYDTSDDTACTLVVADMLRRSGPDADAGELLARLHAGRDGLPGIGPSTTAALDRFARTGATEAVGGSTNGAAMRSLPIGWACPAGDDERRRSCAWRWARATHGDADAAGAAVVVAACASAALDGAPGGDLVAVARDEAEHLAHRHGAHRLAAAVDAVARGCWQPSRLGVPLDAPDTLAAVLWCAVSGRSLRDAVARAVCLGGDTDTVAALTAGLLGCAMTPEGVAAQLPWLDRCRIPGRSRLAGLALALADRRRGFVPPALPRDARGEGPQGGQRP